MFLRFAGLVSITASLLNAQGQTLTLSEALELAERNHPQLKAAEASIAGASAAIRTAKAYPNPEVSTGFGRQQITQVSSVPGQSGVFSLAQPLELSSLRRARTQVAEIGRQSSEYGLSQAHLEVRAAVKQSFYDALRRQSEVDLARDNLKLVEDLRRRIEIQVRVGEAARLELTRADAEVASAGIQIRSSELRRTSALAALRAAIGLPPGNLIPQGTLDPAPLLPDLPVLREDLLRRHPLLGQADAEVRRGEARLALERELRKPQPTFRSDVERQPDAYVLRLGVSVSIPTWNRREGPIAEAAASIREAGAMAELRKLELTAALERAYGQYQVANEQMSAIETGAIKQAEAALQAAEAAFRFGERGIIEVLDAQRMLRNVRFDYLNAQYDRQSALIELERLRAIDLGR